MRPLAINALQTPASLYAVSESESPYGGRTFVSAPMGTIWGDFKLDVPSTESTAEGDSYVRQQAVFICRSSEGIARGAVLAINGFDWTILSLDEDAAGTVRLRLERIHQ